MADLSEESLQSSGRSARKAVEEAGFSEDLKRQLEQKIADANFRSEHASAFAQVEMPSSAGRGTREMAAAKPWTGSESVEDASLRMLNDAYKPIRVPSKLPGIRSTPRKIDTGRPSSTPSTGAKLANARDRTSIYALMKDPNMSESEKEKFRTEMKERFQPHARPVPGTIQGLASLANERIEDAIARGQFKNLPRGKKIERDYTASSPFLDTTEYFMNKIIQKQEIVPPWIEKQQELVSTATKFRARLRAEWKRHAARSVASKGGTVQDQIRMAQAYAAAEAIHNPTKRKEERINVVDDEGHLSQITLSGDLKSSDECKPSAGEASVQDITITTEKITTDGVTSASHNAPTQKVEITAARTTSYPPTPPEPTSTPTTPHNPSMRPFRDPTWEAAEASFHKLALENLNTLTRSYNLMAPNIAKKPYFSLDRELRACYADVAPLLPQEILERSRKPKSLVEVKGHRPGGVMEKFSMSEKVRVADDRRKPYGFKEFWRDLFGKGDG